MLKLSTIVALEEAADAAYAEYEDFDAADAAAASFENMLRSNADGLIRLARLALEAGLSEPSQG